MRKVMLIPLLVLFLNACQEKVSEKELKNLGGYWEIQRADLPGGETKEYTVNASIDYFEIKEEKGFRQKVVPQFDGSYLTNELKENFEIVFENGKAWIHYHMDFADWKEELLVVKPNRLVVKNEHEIVYHYKRPEPFSKK